MACRQNHIVEGISRLTGPQKVDIDVNSAMFDVSNSILKMLNEENDAKTRDALFEKLRNCGYMVIPNNLFTSFLQDYVSNAASKIEKKEVLATLATQFGVKIGSRLDYEGLHAFKKDFVRENMRDAVNDFFMKSEVEEIIKSGSMDEELGEIFATAKWESPFLLNSYLFDYDKKLHPTDITAAIDTCLNRYLQDIKRDEQFDEARELFHRAEKILSNSKTDIGKSDVAKSIVTAYGRITKLAKDNGNHLSQVMKRDMASFLASFHSNNEFKPLMKMVGLKSTDIFDYGMSALNNYNYPPSALREKLLDYARKPSNSNKTQYDKQYLMRSLESQFYKYDGNVVKMSDKEIRDLIYEFSKVSRCDEFDRYIMNLTIHSNPSIKMASVWSSLRYADTLRKEKGYYDKVFFMSNSILDDAKAPASIKDGAINSMVRMAQINPLSFWQNLNTTSTLKKDSLVQIKDKLSSTAHNGQINKLIDEINGIIKRPND